MTTPPPPARTITADQGFARLMNVLAVWMPARLHHTSKVRKGIRNLKRGR